MPTGNICCQCSDNFAFLTVNALVTSCVHVFIFFLTASVSNTAKVGTSTKGRALVCLVPFKAKRFEVLDSLRPQDSPSLITHATKLMNGIKKAWLIAYKDSSKQIQDYDLVYIDVFKQDNGLVFLASTPSFFSI